MAESRLSVFVSATTGDLRETRRAVRDALLTMDHVPIEQTNFPPEASTVREMLTKRIRACDAVIHIAGLRFGSEPREPEPGKPRRSYTQMEYEIARELKKKVYTFVCEADYPYDASEPEDAEKAALQQAHRARLVGGDQLFEVVATRDELEKRVGALQAQLDTLSERLRKTRRLLSVSIATGVLAVLGLASFFVYVAYARTTNTQHLTAARELGLDLGQLQASDLAPRFARNDMQQAELRVRVPEALRTIVASNQASMEADFGDGVWTQVGRDYVGGGDLQGVLSVDARNASGPLRLRIGPPWGHGSGPSFGPFSYDISPARFAAQEATSARSSDQPWLVHEGMMWQAHPTVLDALFPQVVAMRMGSEPDNLTQHIPTTGQGGAVEALIGPMKWKNAVVMATYNLDRQDRIYAQLEFRDGTKSAVREFVVPAGSSTMMSAIMGGNVRGPINPPQLDVRAEQWPTRAVWYEHFCTNAQLQVFADDSAVPLELPTDSRTLLAWPEWKSLRFTLMCDELAEPISQIVQLPAREAIEVRLPIVEARAESSAFAIVALFDNTRVSLRMLNARDLRASQLISVSRTGADGVTQWSEFRPLSQSILQPPDQRNYPVLSSPVRVLLVSADGTEQGPFTLNLAPLRDGLVRSAARTVRETARSLVRVVRVSTPEQLRALTLGGQTIEGLSLPAGLVLPATAGVFPETWIGVERIDVLDMQGTVLSSLTPTIDLDKWLAARNQNVWPLLSPSMHATFSSKEVEVQLRFILRDGIERAPVRFPVADP
jgi:hypothetical protein